MDASEVGLSPGDVTSFGGVRTRLARNSNSSFMLKFLPLTSPTATRNGFFADGQNHSFEFNYDLLTGNDQPEADQPVERDSGAGLADESPPSCQPPGNLSWGLSLYLKAVPATGTGMARPRFPT